MADHIESPWTDQQVDALNRWQESPDSHPFTCANRNDGQHVVYINDDWGVLVATRDGWVCPDCDYRQTWAYAEMARSPHEGIDRLADGGTERPHLPDRWLEDRLREVGLTDEAIAEVNAIGTENEGES